MKTRNLFFSITVVLVTIMFVFTSCDNTGSDNDLTISISDSEIEQAEDDALVDAIYDDIESLAEAEVASLDMDGYNTSTLKSLDEDVCWTRTVDHPDSTHFPKVITIDFGEEGCTVVINDVEVTRKGIIQITVTGRYFEEGSTRTVTLIDYYVNDMKIEGTRTVTNLGRDEDGSWLFSIELVDGEVIVNDTISLTRNSLRYRNCYFGNRYDRADDEFLITGEINGVNARGENYSRQIIDPLHKTSCMFFVSGSIETIVGDNDPIFVDYGDGECDNEATVSRNGNERKMQMQMNHRNGGNNGRNGNHGNGGNK